MSGNLVALICRTQALFRHFGEAGEPGVTVPEEGSAEVAKCFATAWYKECLSPGAMTYLSAAESERKC